MEPATAANQNQWTILDMLNQMGNFSPILALVAAVLSVWLCILFFRTRPLSDYFAYIAATLYPILLGVAGSALSAVHVFYELGENGMANPGHPDLLAHAISQLLLRLITGSLLTCIFFPLGILVLLIRRPK